MGIISKILVLLVGLEHIYIMILEMFLLETKSGQRAFGIDMDLLKNKKVKTIMANLGLYNGFLGVGLFWSLLSKNILSHQIALYFIICIVIVAIYGAITSSKKILLLQGLPAILTLISLLLKI